jgi:hypothetical protein
VIIAMNAKESVPVPRSLEGPLRLIVRIMIMATSLAVTAKGEQTPKSLRVRAQLSGSPYYVGQAMTLQVSVIAHGERPSVVTPRIVDADVIPLGVDLKPISASGIGSLVLENNQFLSRYRIVPRRPGVLKVPAISARLGERSGVSEPIRVTIEKVPDWGRPGSFLGGVGPFELEAGASPSRVRVGQVLDYHLRVTGPAALGMTQSPQIDRDHHLSPGLRIEPEPAEAVAEPPSRVFRFRLRPTRAGNLVIPPVAIAAFDPKLRRYMTKASPSVAVQVVDVPRFDASRLEYVPRSLGEGPPWPRILAAVGVGTLSIALCAGACLRVRRSSRRRRSRLVAGRLLTRVLGDVDGSLTSAEAGRRLTEGLAEYLHLVRARPRGVLTPEEAREGLAAATRDDGLGDRAGRLVARCDRAQYAIEGPSTEELLAEARPLFDDLGRVGEWERRGEQGTSKTERGS